MGQYYYTVNLDKKEYLHPHKFDDGLKLMEFGQSAGGTLLGLTILLADGNGRGGGDIHSEDSIVGRWAGDRIVIAGDYADGGKFIENATDEQLQEAANECFSEGHKIAENVNLHGWAQQQFEDISEKVIAVLREAKEWERN
jgi:hypothetical protein